MLETRGLFLKDLSFIIILQGSETQFLYTLLLKIQQEKPRFSADSSAHSEIYTASFNFVVFSPSLIVPPVKIKLNRLHFRRLVNMHE